MSEPITISRTFRCPSPQAAWRNVRSALQPWEIAYYAAFICILIWQGIRWTTADYVLFVPVYIGKLAVQTMFVVFITCSLFLQRRPASEILPIAALGLVFLVSAIVSHNRELLLSFLLIAIAGRDISFKRLALIVFVFSAFLLVGTVLFAQMGLLEIRHAVDMDGRGARSAWGFVHPNRFAFTVFLMCMSWFAMRFPRIGIKDALMWGPSLLLIYFFIDSRTSAMALLLLVVTAYLYQMLRSKNLDRLIIAIVLVAGCLFIVASWYFMVCYNPANSLHAKIDILLSGRFRLAHEYFSNYPPSLFGTSFEHAPVRAVGDDSRLVVDNAFARLIVLYGYVPTAICFTGFVVLCLKKIRDNAASFSFVCFGVMLVVGFSESVMLSFTSNFSLIVFSELFLLDSTRNASGLFERIARCRR